MFTLLRIGKEPSLWYSKCPGKHGICWAMTKWVYIISEGALWYIVVEIMLALCNGLAPVRICFPSMVVSLNSTGACNFKYVVGDNQIQFQPIVNDEKCRAICEHFTFFQFCYSFFFISDFPDPENNHHLSTLEENLQEK